VETAVTAVAPSFQAGHESATEVAHLDLLEPGGL
jgi:hypothetical protein